MASLSPFSPFPFRGLHWSLAWAGLTLGGVVLLSSSALANSIPLIDSPGEAQIAPHIAPHVDVDRPDTSEVLTLTLPDLLTLTLEGNRDLRNQTLGRLVQRQQLTAAEQAFNPRVTPLVRVDASRSQVGNGGSPDPTLGDILLGSNTNTLDQLVQIDATVDTRLGSRFALGLTPFEGGQALLLRVTQPLLRGFGTEVNEAPLNQARLQESSNQLALRGAVIDTLTTGILSYNALINAQTQVQIQTEALGRRQRELEILQALVQAGRVAPLELFDLERSLADAQRSLAEANNQLDQANSTLLNLIGTDSDLRFVATVETIDQLFAAAAAQVVTYEPEPLVALALANSIDYRQAQIQRQQQELDLLIANDALRWRLDAVAEGNLGDGYRSVVGLVASRTFGDPQPETDRLAGDIRLQQQDNTLAQLQAQIRNDVLAGLTAARSNLQQVEAAQRATFNARRQVEADRARNSGNLFQQINQEEVLVTAQQSELSARIAFLDSIARLEQIVGITLDRWISEGVVGGEWE